jgi:hypothetical protein
MPSDYSTSNRKINRLDIKINNTSKSKEFEDVHLVIAIDSNVIKVINREGSRMERNEI